MLLIPDWPAPAKVRARITTRQGGVSRAPWDSLNLGLRSDDDLNDVRLNRELLAKALGGDVSIQWLHQVHGAEAVVARADQAEREADAAIAFAPGIAATVLTADCLPVLLCDRAGTTVAAAHAGWRGLAAGVLRNTVAKMAVPANLLMAYLGPAISQPNFEVGPEVRRTFVEHAVNEEQRHQIHSAFIDGCGDRLQADIYALARAELRALGVPAIYGGDGCTVDQAERFYSYRRDGVTGRMASLIWLAE